MIAVALAWGLLAFAVAIHLYDLLWQTFGPIHDLHCWLAGVTPDRITIRDPHGHLLRVERSWWLGGSGYNDGPALGVAEREADRLGLPLTVENVDRTGEVRFAIIVEPPLHPPPFATDAAAWRLAVDEVTGGGPFRRPVPSRTRNTTEDRACPRTQPA